jgi:hypothetical protein
LFVVLARVPGDNDPSLGTAWKAPAVLLLSVLPWLAAWQLRNQIETGFGGFSSIVARNLYFYQAAEVEARVQHRPFIEVQSGLGYPDEQSYLARHPEQAGWDQARRVAFMRSEAARVLRAHPGTALKVQLEGSAVVAFTPCAAELLRLLGVYPADGPQARVERRAVAVRHTPCASASLGGGSDGRAGSGAARSVSAGCARGAMGAECGLALDHGWQFRQITAGAEQGENGWLPATVPGDVHLDLLANKKIPDPFFVTMRPSCNGSSKESWEYRLSFEVTPALLARSQCGSGLRRP